MDMQGNDLSSKKNKLYTELTDLLLKGLETESVSVDDSTDASRYILERLDIISDENTLEAFLEEIAKRWPVFKPILLSQREESAAETAQQKVAHIEKEIENISQKS